jgi:hypothetical protein
MAAAPTFSPGRMLTAIVVGEALPIALLVAVVAVFGPDDPERASQFARSVGSWMGPVAGAAAVFGLSWWAGNGSSHPALQGGLIGVAVALIDAGLLAAAGEGFARLFVVSNLGKIAAGLAGGGLAGRRRTLGE